VGLTHFDEAPAREYTIGHLRNRWTMLGEAAGCETVGVRRIQIEPGGWSTPAHEHGRSEEIFYVLAGSGVSWQRGRTSPIAAGDCIVYLARRGEHTLRADEPLDVLAFGGREYDEAVRLPRLGLSTIVNLDEIEPDVVERPRVARRRRDLGAAAGAQRSSLRWVQVAPGKLAHSEKCHSLEEKIFVILSGSGVMLLGDRRSTSAPGTSWGVRRAPASRTRCARARRS
jgi:uncharacterized cupin superfamily protein